MVDSRVRVCCATRRETSTGQLDRAGFLNRAVFYNLFNFANFDLPGNALNGLLTGAAGQINGTTRVGHNVDRVGVGTGVYSLGAPRQLEFGLRLTF